MTNLLSIPATAGDSVPLAIAEWLACLAFLVVLLNGLLKLADRVRGKPISPPNKQLEASQRALEERVRALEAGQDKMLSELHQMHVSLLQTGEERATKMHNRINPLMENTSAIKGSMEAFMTTFRSFTDLLTEHMRVRKN